MIAGAAAIVLMAGAAVVAVTRVDEFADTVEVQCPGEHFMLALTGDPALDCSNEWRRVNGTEPPPMAAYDNGGGVVVVVVVGEPVPEGFTKLDTSTYQTTALIELKAEIYDIGLGISSGCLDVTEARAVIRRSLDQVGLDAWDITVDEAQAPDGTNSCANVEIDPGQNVVQIVSMNAVDYVRSSGTFGEFSRALDAGLKAQCLNLDGAADLTRSVAATTPDNYDPFDGQTTALIDGLEIDRVVDPTASCTRVAVSVGGSLFVTLRGPST